MTSLAQAAEDPREAPSAVTLEQPPVTQYPSAFDSSSRGAEVESSPASRDGEAPPCTAPMAGFNTSEGAYLRSEDGKFSLRLGALLQMRVTGSTTPDPSRKFEVAPTLGRVYLSGNVGEPWIGYFLQTEFAGQQNPFPLAPIPQAPRLLDVWVEARPASWVGVRVGMMRPDFTRSWISGIQRMLMFDRTEANLFFRTHGPMLQASAEGTQPTVPWDRDVGVQMTGELLDGTLEYMLGVFNGNGPLLGRNGDSDVMPTARVAINPLGAVSEDETTALAEPTGPLRLQFGAAAYQNRYRVDFVDEEDAASVGTEEQKTLGVDVTAYGHGVYLSAEAYLRLRRNVTGERHRERGLMAMMGWMFWAPHWELAARGSVIDPHVGAASDTRQAYEGEFNYYHWGNTLKLGVRYSFTINGLPFPGGGVPGSPFTVPANHGIHSGVLLTQVFF